MLNAETADPAIPVVMPGSPNRAIRRYSGPSGSAHRDEQIALTWYQIGEPLLIHTEPMPTRAGLTGCAPC